MMPPENIPASELWLNLSSAARPFQIVPFPRISPDTGKPVGHVAVRALTTSEYMLAKIAADKLTREAMPGAPNGGSGYALTFEDAVTVELLWRSCRDATDPEKSAFPSPQAMRERITSQEIGTLFETATRVWQEIGPLIPSLSTEEYESWIERLIKGGEEADPFDWVSRAGLRALLTCSIERLKKLQTEGSSPGSQHGVTGLDLMTPHLHENRPSELAPRSWSDEPSGEPS